jgi:hypothetical protein
VFVCEVVDATIDFDHELCSGTVEISHIRPDGMLATKSDASWRTAKERP